METNVVLQVMGMDSTKYGGIEHFNVALTKELQNNGVKCVYIYEEEPVNSSYIDDINRFGGEILVLNSRKNPFRFLTGFSKLLKRYRPFLVHAHFTKARFYAIPIAYFMGVKNLFMTIHSSLAMKSKIKPLTRLWYTLANKVVKTIAVSEDIASIYKSNWPHAKVRRIYLGARQIEGDKWQSRNRLGITKSETALLCVANFNHIKGLDVLCKAMRLLKDRNKLSAEIRLYIVGQPQADKLELQKIIDWLEIQEYVKQIGISNDVPDYLLSADIYLQPSRSEGIGMALMEAASVSLPLIGTRVGGIPEIVKDGYNGCLIPPDDHESLANAISGLLADTELRKVYGENSTRVYLERFTINKGVEQTLEYYAI